MSGRGIEVFGERSRVERWFRMLKERTRRFYNNVNAKKVEAMEVNSTIMKCEFINGELIINLVLSLIEEFILEHSPAVSNEALLALLLPSSPFC